MADLSIATVASHIETVILKWPIQTLLYYSTSTYLFSRLLAARKSDGSSFSKYFFIPMTKSLK